MKYNTILDTLARRTTLPSSLSLHEYSLCDFFVCTVNKYVEEVDILHVGKHPDAFSQVFLGSRRK